MIRKKKEETQWIREIAYIMRVNQGPFTRKQLAYELLLIHPDIDIRQLLNEVSAALLLDKSCEERFTVIEGRKYDLKDKKA